MSQDNFEKILDKLIESFDDFKERLIRIEENVRDVKTVKVDVEELKIKNAGLESKTSSAHKRLDNIENNQTWLWRTVISAIIVGAVGLVFFIVQLFIKGGV